MNEFRTAEYEKLARMLLQAPAEKIYLAIYLQILDQAVDSWNRLVTLHEKFSENPEIIQDMIWGKEIVQSIKELYDYGYLARNPLPPEAIRDLESLIIETGLNATNLAKSYSDFLKRKDPVAGVNASRESDAFHTNVQKLIKRIKMK